MQLREGAEIYSLKERLKWNKSSSEADMYYRLMVAVAILCESCVPS